MHHQEMLYCMFDQYIHISISDCFSNARPHHISTAALHAECSNCNDESFDQVSDRTGVGPSLPVLCTPYLAYRTSNTFMQNCTGKPLAARGP